MSDYLGNLAAKSLAPEQTPAVHPRLASRFDPVAPEMREEPGFMEESVEEIVASPARLPRSPEPLSSFPSREVRRRRVERFEEEEVLEAPGRAAWRGGVPSETSPPVPLSHRPSTDRERGNVEQAVVAKVEPVQPLVTIPPPPRQNLSDTSPLSRLGEERWERGTGGEVEQATRPGPEHRQQEPTPLQILQPRVILDRDPFPVRPEPSAPEPVIHVTIGRIEVRATPAPKAPARERQAAKPAVDLEEYLRQRSRGEGR